MQSTAARAREPVFTVSGPIPEREYTLSFVRAAGPGGQNVNKVATAVQLRFNVGASAVLDEALKQRLRALAGRRLTAGDEIVITARTARTQEANRRDAVARLNELVARASIVPRTRHATRPTRGSQERRLQHKSRAQRTKRLRSRVRADD
jgi:ribosome-associated protein